MIQTVFPDSDLHGIPSGAMTRGDQPKWMLHHRWYKADHMGYESLAEVVVSRLLARSNFNTIAPHVRYTPVLLQVSGRQMTGLCIRQFQRVRHHAAHAGTAAPIVRRHWPGGGAWQNKRRR